VRAPSTRQESSVDLGLDGRVYIVTGATSGLGEACAAALLGDGARVLIASRDQSRVDDALARLGGGGPGRIVGIEADLADPEVAARLTDRAMGEWGQIDGLLISGGGPPVIGIVSATDAQWRES